MTNRTFPFVTAKYRTDADEYYAGNPYILALPALPGDATLTSALCRLPAFDPRERDLSAPVRIQRLDRLQKIVVPLPRLVRLARAVLKMICTGYGDRAPYSVTDNQILQDLYELQQTGNFDSVRDVELAEQHSMSLIGASGCGKSFGLRHIAGLFPQAIHHPDIGKWQLPCIFIEMSYDGESVHTLASGLFAELDRLLPDSNYTRLYMEHKGLNAELRLAKALAIAHEHGAGMIFVDEAQNQKTLGNGPKRNERKNAATSSPKSETPLTKLLITASNRSKVPLLMSGTLEMPSLVGSRFTRARRMAGHGSSVWTPLEASGDLSKRGEFEQLLKGLWRYQWIRNPVELTPEWAEIFFRHTQGIPDIMVKLFESVQEAAIASQLETLTPELVTKVFSNEFATTAFGIAALRDGDKVLLDAVTDLYQAEPIQAARDAAQQFPAPRSRETRAKKPPRFTTGVAPVAGGVSGGLLAGTAPATASGVARGTAAGITAGTASGTATGDAAGVAVANSVRTPKLVRVTPSPVAISIEVAADSDLRRTLSSEPGAPRVKVEDFRNSYPV